jgi:copper chaperone NosL
MSMQRTSLGLILIMALALSSGTTEAKEGKQPVDTLPRVIDKHMNCPVCNMYPTRYPKWQSQIVFKDGSHYAFDGCKHLFRFLLNMEKYDKDHSRKDVAKAWVKDFNSGKWIEAEKAHYVAGSSVMGPMGMELIPFSEHMVAMKFHTERGGEMLHFAAVTMDLLRTLDMAKMPMKHEKMKHKH